MEGGKEGGERLQAALPRRVANSGWASRLGQVLQGQLAQLLLLGRPQGMVAMGAMTSTAHSHVPLEGGQQALLTRGLSFAPHLPRRQECSD